MNESLMIVCRGGGDLATGIVHRLTRAGFRVVVLETDKPAAIRRQVSFCEAVYDGETTVEGITAHRIDALDVKSGESVMDFMDSLAGTFFRGEVPVIVDPDAKMIKYLNPDIVIDAIIAKKNLGTTIDMADLVIGVGPGFTAGADCHAVVETKRGHNLGRIYTEGSAAPNTGIPGNIGGYTSERVIHAECAGIMKNICKIGDWVEAGQVIAEIEHAENKNSVEKTPVKATITGIIRGLIRDGYEVTEHFKIADIDPRQGEFDNCFTISDKARSIGGSVLELVAGFTNR